MYRCVTVSVFLVLLASPVRAQAPSAVALDFTLGASMGWGPAATRDGLPAGAAAAMLAFHPDVKSSRVFGISAGVPLSGSRDLVCLDVHPGRPCGGETTFPSVGHVAVLGGFEHATHYTSFRLLAGPSWFGGDGSSGAGPRVQLDASGGGSHVAVVIAAGSGLDMRFGGGRLFLASFGIGLRVR